MKRQLFSLVAAAALVVGVATAGNAASPMTTVAAPVRMAPSVVVNVARDAAVTIRWIPTPRITMPR